MHGTTNARYRCNVNWYLKQMQLLQSKILNGYFQHVHSLYLLLTLQRDGYVEVMVDYRYVIFR